MSKIKIYPAFLPLLFWLAACATPTPGQPMEQSPLLGALERKSGRIAYMGLDGNIYTINQGGGDQQMITTDAILADNAADSSAPIQTYLFPTWSPDSQKLSFMKLSRMDNVQRWHIFTAAADGANLTEIYNSDIAPIYLGWSPDNQRVAFLTTAPAGGLLLQMSAPGEAVRVLDAGQPMYWDWSPDGRRLLAHIGADAEARLAILTLQERVIEERLTLQPSAFQSPDWSPDGRQLLASVVTETGQNSLTLIDSVEGQSETLPASDAPLAFAWSPDGQKIAYIASDVALAQGVLGRLTVLDTVDPSQAIMTEDEQVIAFFWSPDSQEVAYFVPQRLTDDGAGDETGAQENLALALHLLDASTGESRRLLVFRPTPHFVNILPFFDQYLRSTTIWSPDGKNVVVPAFIGSQTPQIWVVSTAGGLEPRSIGEGWLAFWSWE